MIKEKFDELKLEVEEDLKITEDNVLQKNLKLSNMYNHYLKIYIHEIKILKSIASSKNLKYKEKYHFYKFDCQFKLTSNKEIETYVEGDEEINKLNVRIQNQEIIVKYLEEVLDNIKSTGYRIKNHIELYKLQHGLS